MGAVINVGKDNAPAETKPQQDVRDAKHRFSCVAPPGKYGGGGLILYQVRIIIVLQPGEILIFPDAIIHHPNEPVDGTCHSLVAFTQ
jgi:hypothetical protein